MENYVFMVTHRGDRTNIMANFKVLYKEEFLKYISSLKKSSYGEQYRYAKVGGFAYNLKEMQLVEFDTVFGKDDFTTEQITAMFRKDISEVYGLHKQRKELKNISSKDLVRGGIYKKADGKFELYLGDVERTTTISPDTWGRKQEPTTQMGKGWRYIWDREEHTEKQLKDYVSNCDILKTNRKVVEFTGKVVQLPKEVTKTGNAYYYNRDVYTDVTKLI